MAKLSHITVLLFFILFFAAPVAFSLDNPQKELKSLDEQVQEIKKDVLAQTVELKRLEEKLLYPSNSQVAFFVSLNNEKFVLDSVEVKLNNKVVAKYLYDYREQTALKKGGVQRIYTGNVQTGDHNLQVSVAGKDPNGGKYRRSVDYQFSKGVGPRFVEIKIAGTGSTDIQFQGW